MERVSNTTLGTDRSRRFLYGGGPDKAKLRRFIVAVAGILNGKRYLIHDRDPLFTAEFLGILADIGVRSVKLGRSNLLPFLPRAC